MKNKGGNKMSKLKTVMQNNTENGMVFPKPDFMKKKNRLFKKELHIKGKHLNNEIPEITNCKHCNFMIGFEDEDKWTDPIACGACGRSKKDLIKLQRDYEKTW